jgi:hypothetical protein
VAVAVSGAGVVLAGSAAAQTGRLDGDFRFINGPTSNTWTITTQCSPEGLCAGTVSGSTGLLMQIKKAVDGPWMIERHDVPNGRVCVDGSSGPADQTYTFDPVTLVGTLTASSKPGVCNDPNPGQDVLPISLIPV